MTQFEKDLRELLYEASLHSKDYEVVYSEFVEKYESIFSQILKIKEFIKNGTHRCDFGCDNDCEMDGSLHSYMVEDLENMLDGIGDKYNESIQNLE